MLRNRLDEASRLLWLKAGWILVLAVSTGFVADTGYRFFLLGETVSPLVLEGTIAVILVALASVCYLGRLERTLDEVAAAMERLSGQAGRKRSGADAVSTEISPSEQQARSSAERGSTSRSSGHAMTPPAAELYFPPALPAALRNVVAKQSKGDDPGNGGESASGLEINDVSSEMVRFDLESAVFGTCALIAPRAEAEGVELIVDLDSDVPKELIGDAVTLGQVLSYLLGRAVEVSPPGEVMLKCRVMLLEAGRIGLRFAVDCRGTPAQGELGQDIAASDGVALGSGGMLNKGIDFEICERLMADLGGRIGVEGRNDGSTLLTFDVPFRVAGQTSGHAASYAVRLRAYAGRRVMVIDDSAACRRVIGALLAQMGFVPDLFESGQLALARLLSAGSPNYLFCCVDRALNGLDGFQMVQRLRAYYGAACPPVLLMGSPAKASDLGGADRGATAVISKPCGLEKLFHFVASILPVPAADNIGERYQAERSLSARLKGKKILLAATQDFERDLLADGLRQAQVSVCLASDGLAVLQAVREERPDGIVMACRLPGMAGFEAARRLRHGGCTLPIIALGTGASGERERCLGAGMSDLVGMPVHPPALLNVLAQWLAPSRLQTRSVPVRPELPAAPVSGDNLPPLPAGLDVESGLRRLQGRKALFLKALRMFRDSRGHQFQFEFRTAVAAQDWQTSERLAHSLKDTAATIGAHEVSAAAASLEAAIRSHHYTDVQPLLADVTDKLQAIVDGLAHIR